MAQLDGSGKASALAQNSCRRPAEPDGQDPGKGEDQLMGTGGALGLEFSILLGAHRRDFALVRRPDTR